MDDLRLFELGDSVKIKSVCFLILRMRLGQSRSCPKSLVWVTKRWWMLLALL